MTRRLFVEGAVIGREQILGERQPGNYPLQLDPEAPAHVFAVFRELFGRLKTRGMFGCHRSRFSAIARQIAATDALKIWGGRAGAASLRERPDQATPSCLAIAFIAFASSISSAVTPPASWVARTTSTVL